MKKIQTRYAVVGLGHIAQAAVLPAFRNCVNSKLVALVSRDREKLSYLGQKYNLESSACFEDYNQCLASGKIDAVYLAVPNHLHCEYTLKAAGAGLHVLCEKPMAVTSIECLKMIQACEEKDVHLMIAYRLHFEAANLTSIDLIHREKRIGDLRIFHSIHSQAVNYPNIRTLPFQKGGGPTYDIGVYDINSSRYIFQDEPLSVFAEAGQSDKPAFKDIEESMVVTLRFPNERLASLVYSFGATDTDTFRVAGTKGDLRLDPAYTYRGTKQISLTIEGKKSEQTFEAHDHFSPEIDYFSECIQNNRTPEPSGLEGLADIKIIEAIYLSAQTRKLIELNPFQKSDRPSILQEINRPPISAPEVFHAEKPTRKKAA